MDEKKAGDFLETMKRRFACKRFRSDIKLSDSTLGFLLECGRLSPSSFGLEPWRFVFVRESGLITALGDACFAQDAVYTSPCVAVIFARKEEAFRLGSDFLQQRAGRFPGGYPVFEADYEGYHEFLRKEARIIHWARAQTYIACANMMTGAASIGIDSCPIEGFDEERVLAVLKASSVDWTVGLILAFGLRNEGIRPKIREESFKLSEII